jgi:hypothetical protein
VLCSSCVELYGSNVSVGCWVRVLHSSVPNHPGSIHGGLLALGELLMHTGEFLLAR